MWIVDREQGIKFVRASFFWGKKKRGTEIAISAVAKKQKEVEVGRYFYLLFFFCVLFLVHLI